MKLTGARPFEDDRDRAGGLPEGPSETPMPHGAGAVEDSILRRIVALAMDALGAPAGFISFAAADRQLVRVQIGIAGPLRPVDLAAAARPDRTARPGRRH